MIWHFLKYQQPKGPKLMALRYPKLHDGLCAYLAKDSESCRELIQLIAANVAASTRQELLDRTTDVIRDGFAFAKNGVDAVLLLHLLEWWEDQPSDSSVYEHDTYDAAGLHLQEYCKKPEFREYLRGLAHSFRGIGAPRLISEALSMYPDEDV